MPPRHGPAQNRPPRRERTGIDTRSRRRGAARLSAVIACYRDAPAVPFMYERLRRTFEQIEVDYEIVFVNDGSPDDARAVLAELARRDPAVVVVNHTRAFGSQSAFTSGMRIATGDAVVLLDGDLQDPPELIARFVERWREGFDVVYGVRTAREATAFMQRAYKLFYRAFRRLSYVSVPLDAGDFGLLDRRVVDALNDLPESHRFIRGLRAWVGFRQTGVPYSRPERMFGTTTNSLVKNIGWARRAIVSFSYAPLDLIAWLALATVGLSLLGLATQFTLRLADPRLAPKGFTTVIVEMLFIGGIQLLCLAIVGSYVAHIYEESKQRPPFLVESILNAPAPRTMRPRRRPANARGAPANISSAPANVPGASTTALGARRPPGVGSMSAPANARRGTDERPGERPAWDR
jgi:dolichol-phosphate mannosyltransferase